MTIKVIKVENIFMNCFFDKYYNIFAERIVQHTKSVCNILILAHERLQIYKILWFNLINRLSKYLFSTKVILIKNI